MTPPLLLEGMALLAAAALCAVLLVGRGRMPLPRAWSPYGSKPLLTSWERHALLRLQTQIPSGFHVCPQVRLADMLTVAGSAGFSAALGRVAAKSVDFAIIDAKDGRVVLVVELDDRTHHAASRRARDRFVANVLQTAGIPLVRFRPNQPIDIGATIATLA